MIRFLTVRPSRLDGSTLGRSTLSCTLCATLLGGSSLLLLAGAEVGQVVGVGRAAFGCTLDHALIGVGRRSYVGADNAEHDHGNSQSPCGLFDEVRRLAHAEHAVGRGEVRQ